MEPSARNRATSAGTTTLSKTGSLEPSSRGGRGVGWGAVSSLRVSGCISPSTCPPGYSALNTEPSAPPPSRWSRGDRRQVGASRGHSLDLVGLGPYRQLEGKENFAGRWVGGGRERRRRGGTPRGSWSSRSPRVSPMPGSNPEVGGKLKSTLHRIWTRHFTHHTRRPWGKVDICR